MHNQAKEAALNNVKQSIDVGTRLPGPVFLGPWAQFLFVEAYALFRPTFTDIVRSLLCAENSRCCCLLNLGSLQGTTFARPDAFYFATDTTDGAYAQCLRESALGWAVMMDDYACASDVGEWCMYCEKGNDVAVVGLRSRNGSDRFHAELDQLRAEPIGKLLAEGQSAPFPYSRLTRTWRDGLLANYSATNAPV
jgi:hypothetical protein